MIRKTVLARALSIAFTTAIVSAAVSTTAYAQSNTAGSVSGRATPGAVITIQNASIGLNRTITVDSAGTYQVTQLPPGEYVLKAVVNGAEESRNVSVAAGSGTSANFDGGVQKVVVAGRATKIDVKSPESSLVLNKAVIDRLPVARDVTAVALLAPGAVSGDTRIGATSIRGGNVPSLGGASPAENVYYINGFNVTNSLNGVAFNQVPFEAIGQQQIKTGGYGAEYGRSLGGVLNVTTKRGTNEWHGGANVIYRPESMSGSSVYNEKSVDTGKWELHNRPGGTEDLKSNLWIGGPVIKDKLFVFGLVQAAKIDVDTYNAGDQTNVSTKSPQYLLKVDWNINDKNLLEFTGFSDKTKETMVTHKSPMKFRTVKGDLIGTDEYTTGGQNLIAKYTSWITDDLTVSAMFGKGTYDRASNIQTAACSQVQDTRSSTPVRKGCWTATAITPPAAKDERTAMRIDAEWNIGAHGLRFGMDNEEYDVIDGTVSTGTDKTSYFIRTVNPGSALQNGYVNNTGVAFDYIEARLFENGGTFTTKNSAFYLEDNWQVTKNVVANIGVRSESFNNLNADGIDFINVKNTIAPRLGVVWDVQGNAETKVFANAGRYYIPVMSNTNVRLSGAETDYTDYHRWDGTYSADRFQIPGKGAVLGTRYMGSDGKSPDPRTVVDPNLKPMFQDEFIVGAQQALGNRWTVSAKATFRNLKSVMDDICARTQAYDWARANSYSEDDANLIADTVDHCFLYNPGGSLTANVDFGSGLKAVTIPAEALKFPKPKRTYTALELGFERAWDGKWSLQGSYVLGFSKGNTEGYVKSDNGQDDAGITSDWDLPGLAEGAEGYLPNDRRHTLKAFGAYQVSPEWRLGGNVIVQSGRPRNCLGYYAGTMDPAAIGYRSVSFYCNGVLSQRGSKGRTDWKRELSLQLQYAPQWQKGLSFTVDALNIFNERTVLSVNEAAETGVRSPSPTYERASGVQNARTVRFTAQYEF